MKWSAFHFIGIGLWGLLGAATSWAAETAPGAAYLFVTFRDPGTQGIYFCESVDAKTWTMLRGGEPWIRPAPDHRTFRDPFIARGPAGDFHLVWTAGARGIGYARSANLTDWEPPRRLALFPDTAEVRNIWAPEIYWNTAKSEWLCLWSSTLSNRFPETLGQVESGMNHRIYAATTKDFVSFTAPRVFFDPGYPVIDATLFGDGTRWFLVFKDERRNPLRKQLRVAESSGSEGPWSNISEPFTASWCEGPSVLRAGGDILVYYDQYKPKQRMGALRTADFRQWTDITDETSFPAGTKHGGFIALTAAEAARLRAAPAARQQPVDGRVR